MKLLYFNQEQLLIGKLKKSMFKPFNYNDKILIEKNLKNIFGLKLLYSNYTDESGKVLADTVGIDKEGRLYFIGYKKSPKDDFLKRYTQQYQNLMNIRGIFEEHAKVASKRNDINLFRSQAIFISSKYTPKEIEEAKNFPIPCELYTWTLIGNIIIFDKVEK